MKLIYRDIEDEIEQLSFYTSVNTGEASLVVDVKSVDFKITFQFFEDTESEDMKLYYHLIRMSKNNQILSYYIRVAY